MSRLTRAALVAAFSVWLAGCATPAATVVPVYATLKLIERGAVDPQEVIDRAALVEAIVTEGIELGALGDMVRQAVGYYSLQPSDRYLIDTIMGDVAHRLQLRYDVPLSTDHVEVIRTVLRAIQATAAAY